MFAICVEGAMTGMVCVAMQLHARNETAGRSIYALNSPCIADVASTIATHRDAAPS